MNPETPGTDVLLHHYLDASMRQTGGKLDLDTPAGPLSLTLPPGLTEGQTLRLAGRGKLGQEGHRGDVLLTVSFYHTESPSAAPSNEGPAHAESPMKPEALPAHVEIPAAEPASTGLEAKSEDKDEKATAKEEGNAALEQLVAESNGPAPEKSSAKLTANELPPRASYRLIPIETATSEQPAADAATTTANAAWQIRAVLQVGLFVMFSAAGVVFLHDLKTPPFSVYVTCALIIAWVCQGLFIWDARCPARTPTRIGLLRVLRMVMLVSVAIGLIAAHAREDWPFENEVEVRYYSNSPNPMLRRSEAFWDLFGTVFWAALFHLILPFLPILGYSIAVNDDKGRSSYPLRFNALSGELREPIQDPELGTLEWDREEQQWRGQVNCSTGRQADLFFKGTRYDPPSQEQRALLRSALPRMQEMMIEAVTECYGRMREFCGERRSLKRLLRELQLVSIHVEPDWGEDKRRVRMEYSDLEAHSPQTVSVRFDGEKVDSRIL